MTVDLDPPPLALDRFIEADDAIEDVSPRIDRLGIFDIDSATRRNQIKR